eukprot:scaffold58063_cov19-Tisochrysis_lutea.AAC.7
MGGLHGVIQGGLFTFIPSSLSKYRIVVYLCTLLCFSLTLGKSRLQCPCNAYIQVHHDHSMNCIHLDLVLHAVPTPRFDVVVVDEAAQAVEPATLVPIINGCKQARGPSKALQCCSLPVPGLSCIKAGGSPCAGFHTRVCCYPYHACSEFKAQEHRGNHGIKKAM